MNDKEVLSFLRSRLDADEREAPEVHAASCPAVDSSGMLYAVNPDSCTCGWPKRVLAEVDAKRRLLAEHEIVDPGEEWQHCRVCQDRSVHDAMRAPCPTLRLMALPHAEHPDYRDEWRPRSGQPGDGCDDPRNIHPHWCAFCGAKRLFSTIECQQLAIVPPCPRCGERQWRTEVDELTAPDYREVP